jgi:hypothetical protein
MVRATQQRRINPASPVNGASLHSRPAKVVGRLFWIVKGEPFPELAVTHPTLQWGFQDLGKVKSKSFDTPAPVVYNTL